MEGAPPPKQEIAYTRSFGQPVTSLHELTQAVTEFASGAGAKLRLQGGLAGQINVFIHTSPFRMWPTARTCREVAGLKVRFRWRRVIRQISRATARW